MKIASFLGISLALAVALFGNMAMANPIIITFDDLASRTIISGSIYEGLTWEWGNEGYQGFEGYWVTDSAESGWGSFPQSEPNVVLNGWGCAFLGITFPVRVNVEGAYFAGHGDPSGWTTGIKVHGYLAGSEIAATDWFTDIDETPDWFAVNLDGVDRIVIESIPVTEGGGWYGMDNFTYSQVPEPSGLVIAACGLAGLMWRRRR